MKYTAKFIYLHSPPKETFSFETECIIEVGRFSQFVQGQKVWPDN